MGAEVIWLGTFRGRRFDPRPRCRYCARVLLARPVGWALAADEFEPHCAARRCRVCAECAAGGTAVSPVRRAAR